MDFEKLTNWEVQVWEALEDELEEGTIDLDLNDFGDSIIFAKMVRRVARSIYESQMEEMGYGK